VLLTRAQYILIGKKGAARTVLRRRTKGTIFNGLWVRGDWYQVKSPSVGMTGKLGGTVDTFTGTYEKGERAGSQWSPHLTVFLLQDKEEKRCHVMVVTWLQERGEYLGWVVEER